MEKYRIKSERVPGVEPRRFKDGGKKHFYVRLYIDAAPPDLERIELVKYELHPTFKNRNRFSDSASSNFEIKIWTYGYFDMTAKLIMRNGESLRLEGYVRW